MEKVHGFSFAASKISLKGLHLKATFRRPSYEKDEVIQEKMQARREIQQEDRSL